MIIEEIFILILENLSCSERGEKLKKPKYFLKPGSNLSTGLWPGDMTKLMILTLSELKSDWLSQPKVSRPAVVITRQLAESLTDQHHVMSQLTLGKLPVYPDTPN